MSDFIIPIPNKRSELESTRAFLLQQGQDTRYIDTLLADVDAGKAKCLPEDTSKSEA